jgi:hypothetical protein
MNLRPFIPLGIALLVLLGAATLYTLGYETLTGWATKAGDLSTKIAQKNYQLEHDTAAHAAFSTLAQDEVTINQYSVDKRDIVPFLETLQSSGAAVGSKVEVLSVSDQTVQGHNRISLSLAITGSFDAVMRTLGEIENGPYDGIVTSASLSTQNTGTSSARSWTATTQLSVGTRTAPAAATSTKP